MEKAPRFQRKPEAIGNIRLQPRDLEIIKLAWDYRFLNSEQIQALVNGSEQVILRRLQKLFHHGYLDRPLSQIVFSNPLFGPQKLVYALGDKGADVLSEEYGIDRGNIIWREKNKEAGERYILHTLMISNFRASLKLALNNTSKADLLFWERDNPQELRFYVQAKDRAQQRKLSIIPDGFFGIKDLRGEMYFFLEADRSTMTNARFMNKMKAYKLWWRQGGQHTLGIKNFRVLTLTKTKRRMENLINVTRQLDDRQAGSYMFWFTTVDNIHLGDPKKALGAIWLTSIVNDNKLHSLLE